MGRGIAISVVALLLPLALLAQTDDLRSQIRADIMQDPRSAEMTETEIDLLVEALAQEAEQTGAAADYLEAKNTFDPSTLFAPPSEPSAVARFFLSPLFLAIVFLLLVLSAVIYYIIHRGKPTEAPDLE